MKKLTSKEDVLRKFFFVQSMSVASIAFAAQENATSHMVLRFKVGETANNMSVFCPHLNHTDNMNVMAAGKDLVVDIRVSNESMRRMCERNHSWDEVVFINDSYGNRHFLPHLSSIHYLPNTNDRANSRIDLVPWELNIRSEEGTEKISDVFQ